MAAWEDGRCYCCGKRYLSRVGVFLPDSRCGECGAPLCLICWNAKRRACAGHAPAEPPAAPAPSPAPAAPAPPAAISRAAARDAELAFLARVERSILEQHSYPHPGEARAYEPDERMVERADLGGEEARRLLRAGVVAHPAGVFAEMPLNRAVLFPVAARSLLGRSATRVLVAGCSLSPLADMVDPGWSVRRMEYHDGIQVVQRLAADPSIFHYFALFAPTGWSDDARQLLAGGANALVALLELRGRTWVRLRSDDERWRALPLLFELHTESERAEIVAGFVRERTFELLMGWVNDRFVADAVGLDLAAVRSGFESVCRADRFVRGEIDGDGYRLLRVY